MARMSERLLSETGHVAAVREGEVDVTFPTGDACSKCGMCLVSADGGMQVTLHSSQDLEIGQRVRVTFPYRSVWKQATFLFVVPLGSMLAALAAAALYAGSFGLQEHAANLLAVGAGAAGLAAGAGVAILYESTFRRRLGQRASLEVL